MRSTRREFLAVTTSCAAHLGLLAAGLSGEMWARPRGGGGSVAAQEPWGRLESIGDGLWALISTPLEDRTTLCNGGIVAGGAGTVVVESFATPQGARWMAEQARRLTGRWPTHVVLSHFHGDHTGGIAGFADTDGVELLATGQTRDLVVDGDAARQEPVAPARSRLLADVVVMPAHAPTTIHLGDRSVRIVPRDGHTPSDVSIEVPDARVVYCGDLVWNRMFPNYRDATPSRLSTAVRALQAADATVYVPGHGPLADAMDLQRYIALLDHIEDAARRAHAQGIPAAEAAATYSIPEALGEWMMFSDRYFEVALGAWERELRGS